MAVTGLIVMGVSGSGKTTVGKALAERLGWEFLDADDFHPPENKAKMAAQIPLDDADRAPWLAALHAALAAALRAGRHPVLACSALKEEYRQALLAGNSGLRIIYLKGSFDLIRARMDARSGHYMKPAMLQSQFDALQEPAGALVADVSRPPDELVNTLVRALRKEEGEDR